MDATLIKLSRARSLTVGLVGLTFVALCIPLVVVGVTRTLFTALLAIPFAAVLVWLAFLCVQIVLARAELRLDRHGLTASSRGQDVSWAWDAVSDIGFVTHKGRDFVALRLVDGAARPRLRSYLYPSWSDELTAVVLGPIGFFPMSRAEIQGALRPHAGERWKENLPANVAGPIA